MDPDARGGGAPAGSPARRARSGLPQEAGRARGDEASILLAGGLAPTASEEPRERRNPAAREARDRLAGMLRLHPRTFRDLDSELASLVASRIDEVLEASGMDELTGALRRGAGQRALEREIARARRGDGRLTIAFIDVDGLKHVNDSDGHAAGDRLLKTLAEMLVGRLRTYDVVIRWGGDEFVCVLAGCDAASAGQIIGTVAAEFEHQTRRSFSIGYAQFDGTKTPDELVIHADSQLYAAKRVRKHLDSGKPSQRKRRRPLP